MLLLPLLLLSVASFAATPGTSGDVAQWTRYEAALTSSREYPNALQDVEVRVALTAPSGKHDEVLAFWDGGARWLFRYAPGETGEWKWKTSATDAANAGLHGVAGSFRCVAYTGTNVLYRRGPVRVAADRFHLEHSDGTPFFWLSDTAWGGALLSTQSDWMLYLSDRAVKRFSVVQFMGTQNIAAAADAQGRQAFGGREKIVIDPFFFRRLDLRIDAINNSGMVASPTFAWAAQWHPSGQVLDPGAWLPDDQLILFGKYFTARYGAHSIVWMFAGDYDYRPAQVAERWRKLGRAIFGEKPRNLVTVHPAPKMLLKKEFGAEPWFGFYGYQSSHSSADDTVKWIVQGEPAVEWNQEPIHPVINLEPQYEAHQNFGAGRLASALDVRQATWWSLLVSPTAGVGYGGHGVWSWETQPAVPMNHYETGIANPWNQAIHLPGSFQLRLMRDFLDRFQWWTLRPEPAMLAEQPGSASPQKFIAISRTTDKRIALAYLPQGGTVKLNASALGRILSARWFDPSSSAVRAAKVEGASPTLFLTTPGSNFSGDSDWVLWLDLDPR